MASNKHAQIRYKVLDDCFSNFRRKFYFDDLMEKCNDALRELYGDKHTGIKTRTLRADISYIRDRAGEAGVEVEVQDDGNGHYYRYSEPDFSIFKRGLGEIAHPDFWKSVTLEKLEKVHIEIRDLVQFINGDILPDTPISRRTILRMGSPVFLHYRHRSLCWLHTKTSRRYCSIILYEYYK